MTTRDVLRFEIDDLADVKWPRYEVIDGTVIMTPYAGLPHQRFVRRLTVALALAAPEGVEVYPGANVRRAPDDPADLLIPDVVVAVPSDPESTYVIATDVLVAVEVVSPSSRTTDLVTKLATYPAWGVTAYLVVDTTAGGAPTLTWHGDTSALAWAVAAVEQLDR